MKCHDKEGDWQGLDSPTNAPRYAHIARILKKYHSDKEVLDIGCGEGLLRNYLPKKCKYTGIEASLMAVRIALKKNAAENIIHKKAEDFEASGDRFESIVFNEVLYYTSDPVGLLNKYSAMLRQEGVILCSIFQKKGKFAIKKRMKSWLDTRRPHSNVHCTKMVLDFMNYEKWNILHESYIKMPGKDLQWYIWLARPQ